MTATRIARRLGLDGNPLRRRTDKAATGLAALLVAAFLIGAPWLSVAAVGWASGTGTARQQSIRAPANAIPGDVGAAAGHTVSPPVDAADSPANARWSHGSVRARQAAAAVGAVVGLGIVLLCLALAGRLVLDRRRLADWEAAWAAVGPQWTKRFWPRG